MNKLPAIFLLILLSCSSAVTSYNRYPEQTSGTIDAILYSAELFFISINEGEFKTVWELLSDKSRNKITEEIYEVSRDRGVDIEKEDIRRNFQQNGLIARNFWNAARAKFDPDMVLEESKWDIGHVKSNSAEILITYKKSDMPSKVKMYKEEGVWRVGLVETFWPRRYIESFFSFLRM
ncbi:MAG: hypothetical protein JSW20_11335 [Nitrospiraceae bacterium]|nr:MAG: hypothetical protein JSW20_11335 [Nitrospiraceae bacterium]